MNNGSTNKAAEQKEVKTLVVTEVTFSDFNNNRQVNPRIFLSPKGESVLENFLGGRRTRPHGAFREQILPEIQKSFPMLKDAKFKWSQKAGCSCGCSPGFVVTNSEMFQDMHITFVAGKVLSVLSD